MADVEDPMHLRLDLRHVGEVGVLPGNDIARRRLETALFHAVHPGSAAVWQMVVSGGVRDAPAVVRLLTRECRAPFGNGRHATSRPWPRSRTSRQSPRSLPRARY